ncbi:MAG: tetratricopeptide repeat protein [Candidatus Fermentibacteraceae bacterium]
MRIITVVSAAILLLACSRGEMPDPVEDAFLKAADSYAGGDLEGAESWLRTVLAIDSMNTDAWHNLSVVLLEQGRYGEAAAAVGRVLALQPGRSGAQAVLCGALVGMGNVVGAITAGELAVSTDPSDASAFNNLGRAYLEAGRLPDAAACFTTAIRRAPSDPSPHFNLACMHILAGDPASALPLLQWTVSLSPAYPGARTQLAVVYGMLDQYGEAGYEAEMALAMNPGDLMAMNCLALSRQHLGMNDQAVSVYKDMLPLVTDSLSREQLLSRMEMLSGENER